MRVQYKILYAGGGIGYSTYGSDAQALKTFKEKGITNYEKIKEEGVKDFSTIKAIGDHVIAKGTSVNILIKSVDSGKLKMSTVIKEANIGRIDLKGATKRTVEKIEKYLKEDSISNIISNTPKSLIIGSIIAFSIIIIHKLCTK